MAVLDSQGELKMTHLKKNGKKGISSDDASFLCTALGGDLYKDSSLV